MSATFEESGAPPWSRRVWADGSFIYLEIPSRSGPPLIQKYEKCDGGLAKALDLICLAFKQIPQAPLKFQPKGGAPVTKVPEGARSQVKLSKEFTDQQRAKAAAILRKMGIK